MGFVDADTFLKNVKQKAYPQSGINESERRISLFGIMEILTSMPIADVAPVVHGEWIDGYKRQSCSVCHYRGMRSWNYCPHCGADMRGGDAK